MAPLLIGGCQRAGAPYARAPIVLISLDTVRRDSVTGFGGRRLATPEMAAFGDGAIRFDNAIATSHHTAPSHASMLTGFSPFVHGVDMGRQDRMRAIPAPLPTLAETLRAAGYATAGFTDGVQLVPQRGFDRGFDLYRDDYTGLPGKLPDIERFLAEHADRPYFLFAHTYRAHLPYRVPLDLLNEVLGDYRGVFREPIIAAAEMPDEEWFGQSEASTARKQEYIGAQSAHLAHETQDLRVLRRAYDAGVTGADRELGRLIDLLRRTAVFDRAIVVVTSDHGESFMDHDAAGHRDTYDEVIRIPLIVRLPGGEPAGRRIVESFSLDQLASTLLDLVDVESPVSLEGRSVAAALLGAAPIDEEPVFAAWFAPSAISPIYTTMRTRKFKRFDANVPPEELIEAFRRPAPTAFYDLVADPLERNDLAAAGLPEFEEFGRAMASAEERWRRLRQLHRVETPPVVDLDEKTEKALRGLGYLGDG